MHGACQEPTNRSSSGPERAQETTQQSRGQMRAGSRGMPGLPARPQGARMRSATPTTLSRTVKTQSPTGGEKKERNGKHVVLSSPGGSRATRCTVTGSGGLGRGRSRSAHRPRLRALAGPPPQVGRAGDRGQAHGEN